MRYILICTEGENSEPESVRQINVTLFGNASGNARAEIVPVSLGGNHGYTQLIQHADEAIATCGIMEFVDARELVEKYLVCDYDDIEEKDISIENLRVQAANDGYTLIVNKPNFEFFILLLLMPIEDASKINVANYQSAINEHIKKLNSSPDCILEIPKYGKHKRQAENCIARLLILKPTILDEICAIKPDLAAECYSEMPSLIRKLIEIKREFNP